MLLYKLECTEQELEVFFRSKYWKDILTCLVEGIEAGRDELEMPMPEAEQNVIRGRLKQLRMLLDLPKAMMEKRKVQSELLAHELPEEGIEEQDNGS